VSRTFAGFSRAQGPPRGVVVAEIDGTALRLDVTDQESVDAFVAAVPDCRLLVNNAGGAKGLYRMTRALLPALVASGDGHVVTVTSVTGAEIYDNGAGYCAAKRGLTPLSPDDIAEVIAFAATRPSHVNLDQIVVKARDQATATRTYRRVT
jgi:NADP-dependent 3-hydroxy acid dehydrogenase YdfG